MRLAARMGMGERLRRPALTVAVPVILIGLVGTGIAVSHRSGDPLFVYSQRNLTAVQPSTMAHLVSLTSDPRPDQGHTRAVRATCSPRGTGELRNPWSCVVQYGRGAPVRYQVTISPGNGSVSGTDRTGTLVIHGCCVGPRLTQ